MDRTRRKIPTTGAALTSMTGAKGAKLAPQSEISIYPWETPKERIPLAVRQIRSFLHAHLRRAMRDGV